VTSAAGTELLEIEQSRYLPSAVVLTEDGTLATGRAAAALGGALPDRVERLPKRALVAADQVRLGDTTVETTELVAALLIRVLAEARARFGGTAPDTVVLTHPARWGEVELGRLRLAAGKAGLGDPVLVPEPVAAAVWHASQHDVPAGAHVAVYDFGGGTFDTAVLTRAADGFTLLGRPGGDQHLGGEDLDEALLDLVAAHTREVDQAGWDRIWAGETRDARRSQDILRREITTAKETLSRDPSVTIYPPGLDDGIRVTRPEFDAAIAERLRGSVDELLDTIRTAGLAPGDLAAVYLTGGSSRVPLVSEQLTEALGTLPDVHGDPKAVVVLGALHPHLPAAGEDPAVPPPPPPPPPPPIRPLRPARSAGRRRQLVVTAVAAAVIAAALIPALIVKATSNDGHDGNGQTLASSTSASPSPSAPSPAPAPSSAGPTPAPLDLVSDDPTDDPTDDFDSYQKDLYDELDGDAVDLDDCEARSDLEDQWTADAVLSCTTPEDVTTVLVAHFDSSSDMDDFFDSYGSGLSSSGSCADGDEVDQTWSHQSDSEGRLVCVYTSDDDYLMAWGFDDQDIAVVRYDSSADDTYAWWHRNACVVSC
jgi:actin-like ATPase involved in cell morphogenesis